MQGYIINSTALSISDAYALTEKEYYTTVTVTIDHYCCSTLIKFKFKILHFSLDNLIATYCSHEAEHI